MFHQIKRLVTAYTVFVLVTTALTGCKSDVSVEHVDYDAIMAQETDVIKDASDGNVMEIYGRFLEGDIAADRNGQQVWISELFWDNDIYATLSSDEFKFAHKKSRDSLESLLL